jgi:hypothetical protein
MHKGFVSIEDFSVLSFTMSVSACRTRLPASSPVDMHGWQDIAAKLRDSLVWHHAAEIGAEFWLLPMACF